jgi:hypothetical protein
MMSRIDRSLGQNKPRLYLAFYPRGVKKEDDIKFHTALLYVPKDPVPSEKQALRFHVMNKVIRDKEGNAKQGWEFDPNPSVMHNRMLNLLSVALLGKISISEGKLKELLLQVPVKQDDKRWRCRHWAWDAMGVHFNSGLTCCAIANLCDLASSEGECDRAADRGQEVVGQVVRLLRLEGIQLELQKARPMPR